VAVFPAKQVLVQRQWRGYGTAQTMDSADVPARVTATVAEIPEDVLEGRAVERGQLLVQLDDSDYRHAARIAQENLGQIEARLASLEIDERRLRERVRLEEEDVQLAQDNLERINKLFERQAANQQDLDSARRTYITAERTRVLTAQALDAIVPRRSELVAERQGQQSAFEQAQLNVQRSRIVSPMSGVVSVLDVEEGENVASGERVARVVDLGRMEVPLRLPGSARSGVRIGDAVTITASHRGANWRASVARIAPEDDPQTRTMVVFAELSQADWLESYGTTGQAVLTPGTYVAGVVTSTEVQPRWVVPRRAVRGGRILVVNEGRIDSQPVKIDYLLEGQVAELDLPDDQWAVLEPNASGLREGEWVLVNGSAAVVDGQAVEAVALSTLEEQVQASKSEEDARP
jgi:multidrug efflux pump subunit AcrA (membrane-fusion protein)